MSARNDALELAKLEEAALAVLDECASGGCPTCDCSVCENARAAREHAAGELVPGDHSECGPDCVVTGDRCDGSHAPLEIVLETPPAQPATLDELAERIAALEERIDELDIALTRRLRELADQLARLGGSCPECRGHGADPLSDNVNWLPCRSCGGTGKIRVPDVRDYSPIELVDPFLEAWRALKS